MYYTAYTYPLEAISAVSINSDQSPLHPLVIRVTPILLLDGKVVVIEITNQAKSPILVSTLADVQFDNDALATQQWTTVAPSSTAVVECIDQINSFLTLATLDAEYLSISTNKATPLVEVGKRIDLKIVAIKRSSYG